MNIINRMKKRKPEFEVESKPEPATKPEQKTGAHTGVFKAIGASVDEIQEDIKTITKKFDELENK